eukprot:CAMPEP_0204263428 /NCGR_PEP_ID=MMETSP0468-20130131/8351_1 /ASSEMBLY_ACC=CAM_ASM_000383 /TAXON_ID=2969 /ORGANISM="Oxyrrhis marina" /LENGTH=62 /DNA_ID=CAMNT_0051238203 /DNA_START=14 /DNA_END=199 /DNA_ORIENTATION=-
MTSSRLVAAVLMGTAVLLSGCSSSSAEAWKNPSWGNGPNPSSRDDGGAGGNIRGRDGSGGHG